MRARSCCKLRFKALLGPYLAWSPSQLQCGKQVFLNNYWSISANILVYYNRSLLERFSAQQSSDIVNMALSSGFNMIIIEKPIERKRECE